ncbi:MAG: hypothetical protein ABR56_07635 [Acidimicrobium sp. BACL27 MAG-120823-bin4]|nr:MAG: hypothetical protein ABR56_07635 [Acidimicrobium sp. BACL27 MAG-120823-bin4]
MSFPIWVRYRIASHGITGQAPPQANAQKEAQEDASPYPSSTQQIVRFAPSPRVTNATNS